MHLDLIKEKVEAGIFRLSEHADKERENEAIAIRDLRAAILNSDLIEDYPEDKRGHSCLVLGLDSENRPIHSVCGIDKNGVVVIITVYIPTLPKWKNPRERNLPDATQR